MNINNISGNSFKGIIYDKTSIHYLKPIMCGLHEISNGKDILISHKKEREGVFTSENIIINIPETKVKLKNPLKNLLYRILDAVHPALEMKVPTKCITHQNGVKETVFELNKKRTYELVIESLNKAVSYYESKTVYKILENFLAILK